MLEFITDASVIHIVLWILEISLLVLLGMLLYKAFTYNKAKETKIVQKQALTDPLTGRGNRFLFLSVVDKLIKKGKKFAVCFMDLDGFKQINDTMGHDAGDELLISLANTFANKLPKNATAYRLGGDEFAIIIEEIKTTNDISSTLDDLKSNLTVPFIIENSNITLEYSVGVAIFPEDAKTRQDLIMYADDAMYYIKEHGKNDYYFHNKTLRAKLENDNKMSKDLRAAYENSEFGCSLQPRINVTDTSKICFEALLYWEHPVLGKINSDYFIKQAEEMALIVKLDQYILNMACDKLNNFRKKGYTNIQMAVNISNKHSTRKEFVDRLCEIITSNNIKKGEIQLELTGNIEPKKIEAYKEMLDRLKECGAEIIINNMEISYKTVNLFRSLPIDEFKISADYVSTNSEIEKEVFKNIINFIKSLNYKIVVSTIEQEQQLTYSICDGADKIQGNLLFKKMEENLAEDFINGYDNYVGRIKDIIEKSYKTGCVNKNPNSI